MRKNFFENENQDGFISLETSVLYGDKNKNK